MKTIQFSIYAALKNAGFLASVFLCLLITTSPQLAFSGWQYQPVDTRDQNLFNLIHGQPLPTNAELLQQDRSAFSTTLAITNVINIEDKPPEYVYLDYETYRFRLSYQHSLGNYWNLKVDIPFMYQGGGVFDSAIDDWHAMLGLPRSFRPLINDNEYRIQYTLDNQLLVNESDPSTTLGDIQLALGYQLKRTGQNSLSLWTGIKLDTSDSKKLSGSGATDYSFWASYNQQLHEEWFLNLNAGFVLPGTDNYQGIPVSDYAIFAQSMLAWQLNQQFLLKAQLQGHSSYYDKSQLTILGDAYLLTIAGSMMINSRHSIELGLTEDIKVDASPDASLVLNWRYTTL